MKKQMFAPVAVLAVLWVAAQAVPSFSQPKETTPADDLTGKTVLVYAPSVAGAGYHVVTHVEVIHVGGRTYLAGIGADTGLPDKENWEKGLPVRIAADYLAAYYPMTPEQYQILQLRGLPQQRPGR
jgi:hypothetical protein